MEKTGLMLLNLGTPDSPEPEAVGRYLKQFLMDRWVIDIPYLFRWILVNLLIIPKRKFSSAEAYRKVWSERGSPLLTYSNDLTDAVRKKMPEYKIVTAMRYGNPSVEHAFHELKQAGCTDFAVVPMYPQYAESSTRTAIDECIKVAKKLKITEKIWFSRAFYEHPKFIEAYSAVLSKVLNGTNPDHVLFSYHGLPERHIRNLDQTGRHCFASENCCDAITDANRNCYRAQSFATTRAIVKKLNLKNYSISFQSRLGRTPWIKPYTDVVIQEFPKRGIKKLVVLTPSFTADCLETVEEIGIRAKEEFLAAGGESFTRVPCLNSEEIWVDAVVEILKETMSGL
jgi:protoporphyrin/coproporphyrin ferrochelatase